MFWVNGTADSLITAELSNVAMFVIGKSANGQTSWKDYVYWQTGYGIDSCFY